MVANIWTSRPLFARFYVRISPGMERAGMSEHRRQLLAGLAGEVIEVGAGNGLNFAHYPETVTRVVAIEPEPFLRAIAVEAAVDAPVPVEVVEGMAERLPCADESFDAAVLSLVLCSVSDAQTATAELARALRPGGQVRFFEHVQAETWWLARAQRLLDATLWPRIAGGCHASRDPLATFQQGGFKLAQHSRVRFPDGRVTFPTSPHVLGTAVRPGDHGPLARSSKTDSHAAARGFDPRCGTVRTRRQR